MNNRVYQCDQCGACCSAFIVGVTPEDQHREPRISLHLVKYQGYGDELFLDGPESGCAFLENHGTCSIQLTKPTVCHTFKPGDIGCQWARARAGLGMLHGRWATPREPEERSEPFSFDQYPDGFGFPQPELFWEI